MDFSQRHADPRRHVVGIALVVLFHVVVIYALVTGLASKVVDVVRTPVETRLIQEPAKPAPPPQATGVPPPPKFKAPPPPFIPPPEIRIATPPPRPPITVSPEPAPVVVAPEPVAPPGPVAPPAPPVPPPPAPAAPAAAPAPLNVSVVCTNYRSVMGDAGFPREALRLGIEQGDALIQFTLAADGSVRDIKALRSSNPIFARNSEKLVAQYRCIGQGRDVIVTVPFRYKIE